jgi:mannose-6-phosphate isomerase-like protein (cupin superfamily)
VAAYVRRIAAFDAEPSVSHPSSAGNGHAELLQFPSGDTVRILVDGKTSEGSFSVLDCTHVAGPTERHIHADAHKSVFVLAGRYRFVIGDEALDLSPGDEVFIGRGVAHDFIVGIEGGRALFVFSPAGVEEYFRSLAIMADTASSSPATLQELRRRHHIEPVEPVPAET